MSEEPKDLKYVEDGKAFIHPVGGEIEAGEGGNARLKRGLKARHISMISIGGVIGTGLFLGTGGALANGGPLGLLLGYSIMGSVCFSVMIGLGEMCSYLPIEGGHVALAHRFVDPAWAFALSFNYAYNWLIILPVELAAVAILVQYWTSAVNNAAWISIALVIVIIINLFGSRGYGEAEFWFASIKVLTIIGLIFCGIAINAGCGDEGYLGFTYWKNPGPLTQYKDIPGSLGRFLGFWAVLIQAAFSFIGTEIVAIASGETENPRRNLPRAIKRVYIRILLFYILGVFIIGIITPSNSDRLKLTSDAASSPFVIAIEKAGIKALPSIINACLISSAWSAGSSDMYTASRALYAIALNGDLPKVFLKTTRNGLPIAGIITSTAFGCLAYLTLSAGPGKVFNWFANMTAIAGLISWLAISVTYIRFRQGMDHQGFDRSTMPYTNCLSYYGAWYATIMILIITFFSGYAVFLHPHEEGYTFDHATFWTNYIPLGLFPILFVGKKLWSKTSIRRVADMDFITNIAEIEASEEPEVRHPHWWGRWAAAIF